MPSKSEELSKTEEFEKKIFEYGKTNNCRRANKMTLSFGVFVYDSKLKKRTGAKN